MSSILCIYGTTSGNTELVVDTVAAVLKEKGHSVTTQRVEQSSVADLENHDLYILAASTYGHGILQDYMIPFEKALCDVDLSGKKFTVIGLGDNKYDAEYHIESARILEKRIQEQNGEIILTPLKISKSPLPQLNSKVTEWGKQLSNMLDSED